MSEWSALILAVGLILMGMQIEHGIIQIAKAIEGFLDE